MKIKTYATALLVAVALAACSGTTHNEGGQEKIAAGEGQRFAWLAELGIALDSVPVMGRQVTESEAITPTLSPQQFTALLGDVMTGGDTAGEDEGIDLPAHVAGVRALPEGFTLVHYQVEFGDGSTHALGCYDSHGRLTDFVDLGPWHSMSERDTDPDGNSGVADVCRASGEFTGDDSFTLHRTAGVQNWRNKVTGDGFDLELGDMLWAVSKDYRYNVTRQGRIMLNDVSITKKDGTPSSSDLLDDEAGDLSFYASNDPTRLDAMAAMLNRADVKKALADSDDTVHPDYIFQGVMRSAFTQRPLLVLDWLASHRDNDAVANVLKSLFAEGWLEKDVLVAAIEQMPAGEPRQWLERLTAQWGRSDAVG